MKNLILIIAMTGSFVVKASDEHFKSYEFRGCLGSVMRTNYGTDKQVIGVAQGSDALDHNLVKKKIISKGITDTINRKREKENKKLSYTYHLLLGAYIHGKGIKSNDSLFKNLPNGTFNSAKSEFEDYASAQKEEDLKDFGKFILRQQSRTKGNLFCNMNATRENKKLKKMTKATLYRLQGRRDASQDAIQEIKDTYSYSDLCSIVDAPETLPEDTSDRDTPKVMLNFYIKNLEEISNPKVQDQ